MPRPNAVCLALAAVVLPVFAGAAACGGHTPGAIAPDGGEPASGDGGRSGKVSADGGAPTPSKACGTAGAVAPGLQTKLSIDVAGAARSYDLSVPAGYDATRAYPVVFVFHGGNGSTAGVRKTFGFEDLAGDKAIFAYLQGLGDWDLDTAADANPDIAFFDAVLAKLEGDLCVDASRVFATGSSNGAYFTNQLGCRRGSKLRAIAAHAGGGPYENDGNYDDDGHLLCPGAPPAAMIVHGEADVVVPILEGESSVGHWKWSHGCADGSGPFAPDPCVAYDGCSAPVVWCPIPGQGHGVWAKGPQATWGFFASF